ncbi:hypothetical protein ACFL6C_14060, partial [Myxococcota bacterium]
ALTGDIPDTAEGGLPLTFSYRLRDPVGAVDTVSVRYRRESDKAYSSLALELNDTGSWTGEIPGQWTESEGGFGLQYFTVTSDADGSTLLALGSATAPTMLRVEPGTVADAVPLYDRAWFWLVLGVGTAAVIAGSVATYLAMTDLPDTPLDPIDID